MVQSAKIPVPPSPPDEAPEDDPEDDPDDELPEDDPEDDPDDEPDDDPEEEDPDEELDPLEGPPSSPPDGWLFELPHPPMDGATANTKAEAINEFRIIGNPGGGDGKEGRARVAHGT
jgi:hypothetical protein